MRSRRQDAMFRTLRAYLNRYISTDIVDEEFEYYYEAFVPRRVKKRQFILHEGNVCQYSAFIVKGAMRQYTVDRMGIEHVVRLGIEHWWMSDRGSFSMHTPSFYNIDAVEDCDLLMISNAQLQRLTELSPAFVVFLSQLELRYYIASQERIQIATSKSAREKFGHLARTYPEFLLRFPQNMLASYIGITPETFSRVRKYFFTE